MSNVLSIDIGTSSISVLVLSLDDDRVLSSVSAPNASNVPKLAHGRHEQHPVQIWEIVSGLIDRALAAGRPNTAIDALIVTGQMHGVLLIDENVAPLTNLITWRDQRARDARTVSRLNQDPSNAERCGCALRPGYGAGTLHVMFGDTDFAKSYDQKGVFAVTIVDFITAKLSGEIVTAPSMAASWGILNISSDSWDDALLADLRIPRNLLPPIKRAGTSIGTVREGLRKKWPACEAAIVCAGVGDNQASVAASLPISEGASLINVGTGAQVSVVTSNAMFHQSIEIRPFVLGYNIAVGSSLCGGWAYTYIAELFQSLALALTGESMDLQAVYRRMNTLAAGASHDCDGLEMETAFLGLRHDPTRKGSLYDIDAHNLTPANICRSAVRGIVKELFDAYKAMNIESTSIYLAGNAVRNIPIMVDEIEALWSQRPREIGGHEEAALGAAYIAALISGLIDPRDPSTTQSTAAERFSVEAALMQAACK